MYETFYEPTEQDLRDYAQHCKEETKVKSIEDIDPNYYRRINRLSTMAETETYAKDLSALTGDTYLPCDFGSYRSPRYDVIRVPKIGESVSKAFNGDSYPEGTITKISASHRRIETSTGVVFYRYKQTTGWLSNQTWWLVSGHISTRNPCF